LGLPIEKNDLTFRGGPMQDTDSGLRISFHFPHYCVKEDFYIEAY